MLEVEHAQPQFYVEQLLGLNQVFLVLSFSCLFFLSCRGETFTNARKESFFSLVLLMNICIDLHDV